MRKIVAALLTAGIVLSTASVAQAREGCGAGFHRGPAGHCRPNGGKQVVVVKPGARVVGRWYDGRGYWDGRRYWQHRYRHQGAWRYR